MKIAELFVDLGVQGSDKTVGALTGMKKNMGGVASASLEAKVAILGAMYALERMFSQSGQAGTNLTNFTAILGVSAKTLQQYQFAARQAGVANSEVEGTFKSLQGVMTKTLMGEGAPKGLARVAMLTGGVTVEDIKKFAEQPQLLIQKLQEYSQKETNAGLRNEVLKSFGVGDGMIAAFQRNAFTPEMLAKAPTYSDSEIKSLDKANIAWGNLGNKIEMAFGRFNAKHGGQLVEDIGRITDKVIGLTEAFMKLAEKLKIFEVIGKVFEGWGTIFDGITQAADTFENKKEGGFFEKLFKVETSAPKDQNGTVGDISATIKKHEQVKSAIERLNIERARAGDAPLPIPGFAPGNSSLAPAVPALPPAASAAPNNIEVNQTLNFNHDGKDAKRTGDNLKQSVRDAFKQLPSQSQGS